MAFRRNKKMASKPYKKRTGKRTARVGLAVKRYVKRTLAKEVERKAWITYGANTAIATTSGSTPTNINLCPTIAQGITKSTRIGNEVIVKNARITGYVNLIPYNNVNNTKVAPVMIKMWLLSARVINTISLTATSIASSFFDVISSNVGFQGNMLDMLLTPNKESWIIHATKQFKLGLADTSAITSAAYPDNSPFNKYFSFNFGKHLGKLKFDDTGNVPTNKNLFLAFQAVYADGSTDAIAVAEYHYCFRVDYADA